VYERDREREGNQKLEYGCFVHCIGANIIILNYQRPTVGSSKEVW
jgi:hypothetical protein